MSSKLSPRTPTAKAGKPRSRSANKLPVATPRKSHSPPGKEIREVLRPHPADVGAELDLVPPPVKLGQPHQVVGKLYRGGIHVHRKEGWIAKDFKAGYVDPRETQISGVGQDFRKAQLLVAVYSGVCVACQAAETVKPESKLVDDSRRGDVRPAYAQILAAVGDDIPESGQVALPALYGEAERIVLIHIVDGVVSGTGCRWDRLDGRCGP